MGRRTHSKLEALPQGIRLQVDKQLLEGITYAKISEYLKGVGYDISIMCICRYAKHVLKRFSTVKLAKDQAKAILQEPINADGTRKHIDISSLKAMSLQTEKRPEN